MKNLNSRLVFLIICISVLGLIFLGCNEEKEKADTNVQDSASKQSLSVESKKDMKEETKKVINPDGKTPKLTFNEVVHDFGKKTSGPELVHTFHFKNEGDGTLMIEKVKAG